jgi:hypothetical protein
MTKQTKRAKAPAKGRKAKLATPETIKTAVNARTGNGLVIATSADRTIVVTRVDGKVNKLAGVGMPVAPLEEYLASRPAAPARLANGVNERTAPHSAKAVQDQRSTAKGRKARGDSAAVAGKPAKAPKQRTGGRGYDAAAKLTVLVKPKDSKLAEGSGRMAKLAFAAKCKTVGAFLGQTVTDAAGKEHKCDAGALSGMLKREHVRIG